MGVNKVVYGTTTIIDISDSTVAAGNMLKGIVAYGANGDRVTGYGDANLVAGNIKKGVSIFGVAGSYNGDVTLSNLNTCPVRLDLIDLVGGNYYYVGYTHYNRLLLRFVTTEFGCDLNNGDEYMDFSNVLCGSMLHVMTENNTRIDSIFGATIVYTDGIEHIFLIDKNATGVNIKFTFGLCTVDIVDMEVNGPFDVTYKTYENGNLVDKTESVPAGDVLTINAVQSTEMLFGYRSGNFSAVGADGEWFMPEYRYANNDDSLYITVPDMRHCHLEIYS